MGEFTTLPALMLYKIDYGGEDADIHTALSYHANVTPYVHSIDRKNLVFTWKFLRAFGLSEAENGLPPKWLKVYLFRPREPGQEPPPPPAPESSGGFILRGVAKQKEESDLWINYINVYYTSSGGVEVVAHTREDLAEARDNISWPGRRTSHQSYFVGDSFEATSDESNPQITIEEIPLRVSEVVDETLTRLLVLTEIKRTKRLQLNAYQFQVQYVGTESRWHAIQQLRSGKLSFAELEKKYGYHFEQFRGVPEKD